MKEINHIENKLAQRRLLNATIETMVRDAAPDTLVDYLYRKLPKDQEAKLFLDEVERRLLEAANRECEFDTEKLGEAIEREYFAGFGREGAKSCINDGISRTKGTEKPPTEPDSYTSRRTYTWDDIAVKSE